MEIIFTTLHHIDHSRDQIVPIEVSEDNNDLNEYAIDLLNKISEGSGKRKFNFQSATTEVRAAITDIIESENYGESASITANRLLKVEKSTQQNIKHLDVEIQKGVLFQALVYDSQKKKIIIAKAEHNDFLDEQNLTKRKGLPIKKKIYKAFLLEISDDGVEEIFVYDTNSTISKYWWYEFLELIEVYTDEHNTKTAFDTIDGLVLSRIKKKFPSDHNIIRNSIVRYFRTVDNFSMDDFLTRCIGDYQPVDPNLDVDNLKSQIKDLPHKRNFDERFRIIPEQINARQLRNIVPLTEKIDLNIKEDVANLNQIIKAVEEKGVKYIKIKTDWGYEAFKTNN